MSDIEGIFEDSLLSLFDHRPIAFSTAGPHEPYTYVPSPLRYASDGTALDFPAPPQEKQTHVEVYLPIAPSGLHTTLQLTHIWLSSILIADLITCGSIPVKGERICELGAGAGLPGIVAARKGAGAVVATDYAVPSPPPPPTSEEQKDDPRPTDVLAVLRENFRRALPEAQESTSWQVLGHTWGEPVDALLESCVPSSSTTTPAPPPQAEKFRTILLADLLWTTAAHSALITSLLRLLAPDGTAHVVAGLHQGRGAVERFRNAWIDRGGWARDVMEVQWGQEGWEVLRDLRDGREERRGLEGEDEHGTVVYFTCGMIHEFAKYSVRPVPDAENGEYHLRCYSVLVPSRYRPAPKRMPSECR